MTDNKALFDPGFAPLVEHFSGNIDICNQIMSSVHSMHQKKFKYKSLYPQLMILIENNVSFYYGCLLWAFYIVNQYKDSPAEILNNSFYGINLEELENYDYNEEIDFLINYLKTIERDSKYYLGKSTNIPSFWLEILNIYKEFLALNKGFVNVKTTGDIHLPERLVDVEFDPLLNTAIQKCIEDNRIETLLNIKIFA